MATEKLSCELRPRDVDLFRDLLESRVMTRAHIASLHFEGSKEAAKQRVRKLKAAGFLSERPRRVTEPEVLSLTPKAFGLLRERGILHDYPPLSRDGIRKRSNVKDFTLSHELAVMDVKAAFHTAKKAAGVTFDVFSTWPLLHQFEVFHNGATVPVKPDGFMCVVEPATDGKPFRHSFFLEVDRDSETLTTLAEKASCYAQHFRSGGFAVQNGGTRDAIKDFPFRVLIVVPRAKRRNDLAHLLLYNKPPIMTLVYLSTMEEVAADPFGAIWMTPAAYRHALTGTLFDTERFRPARSYRKETERDALVEKTIKKVVLLS